MSQTTDPLEILQLIIKVGQTPENRLQAWKTLEKPRIFVIFIHITNLCEGPRMTFSGEGWPNAAVSHSAQWHSAHCEGWPNAALFYAHSAHWVICIHTNTAVKWAPAMMSQFPSNPSSSPGKFSFSTFPTCKVAQVNLFPSTVWIFYGLSCFSACARHSHHHQEKITNTNTEIQNLSHSHHPRSPGFHLEFSSDKFAD